MRDLTEMVHWVVRGGPVVGASLLLALTGLFLSLALGVLGGLRGRLSAAWVWVCLPSAAACLALVAWRGGAGQSFAVLQLAAPQTRGALWASALNQVGLALALNLMAVGLAAALGSIAAGGAALMAYKEPRERGGMGFAAVAVLLVGGLAGGWVAAGAYSPFLYAPPVALTAAALAMAVALGREGDDDLSPRVPLIIGATAALAAMTLSLGAAAQAQCLGHSGVALASEQMRALLLTTSAEGVDTAHLLLGLCTGSALLGLGLAVASVRADSPELPAGFVLEAALTAAALALVGLCGWLCAAGVDELSRLAAQALA